jgi:hypothetical protein
MISKPTWRFSWRGGQLSYRPADGKDPHPSITAKVRKILIADHGSEEVSGTFDGSGKVRVTSTGRQKITA